MPVSSFANSVGMAKVAVESIKEIFGSLKLTGVGGGLLSIGVSLSTLYVFAVVVVRGLAARDCHALAAAAGGYPAPVPHK